MAIQVESPAQLSELGAVFRRRRWWFIVPVLLSIGIGAILVFLLPNKYEVDIQVKLVEVKYDQEEHFRSGGKQGFLQRDLESAETEIKEPSRLHRLIRELGWVDYQELDALDRQDYIEKVQDNISVDVVAKSKDVGSSFVNLSYMDVDSNRAELFLERLTKLWVEENFMRDQRQIQTKLAAARASREGYLTRVAENRKKKNDLIDRHEMPFDANQRTRQTNQGDPVYERIARTQNRLLEIGNERAKLEIERDRVVESLEFMQEKVLSASIERGSSNDDGKLKRILDEIDSVNEDLANLRPANPEFETLRAKLRELEKLANERTGGTADTEIVERVDNPDRPPLLARIDELEVEIAILAGEAERLTEQFAVDRRAHQTRTGVARELDALDVDIESDLMLLATSQESVAGFERDLEAFNRLGPSYEITKEPLAPESPSSPNVPLVLFGSIVAGAVLGSALLVAREFLVPGFRIPADVASDLTVPILGIVGTVSTRRQRMARGMLGGVTALGTALFLGLVAWFLWAYQERQELLGTDLVERIEEIQYTLR
jgi:polysaccharide biosynthesis transport protein